jgi:hypothetical protein
MSPKAQLRRPPHDLLVLEQVEGIQHRAEHADLDELVRIEQESKAWLSPERSAALTALSIS